MSLASKVDFKSMIPLVNERWELIHAWLGNSKINKVELKYRGSRDTYTAQAFH